MWSWALSSCSHKPPDAAAELAAALTAADAAWEVRGDTGLDVAGDALLAAWRLAPDDPEVGWRLVRWRVAEGLAATDPRAARSSFGRAREQGVACLDGDGLFRQRREAEGWTEAMRLVPEERSACAAWLGMAWVRWMEAIGPEAATLDLPTVDTILAEAGSGDPDVARWAEGLLAGSRPDWAGADPERATRELRDAVDRDPSSVVRWCDFYRWGTDDAARPELLVRIRALTTKVPEDAGALERLDGGAALPEEGKTP